ncbi:hypothetical protein AAC387_Pa07g1386 [Persea americana]
MSGVQANESKYLEHTEKALREEDGGDLLEEPEHLEKSVENSMPSSQEEEAVLKKKYGGLLPKKPPLISKDHERAFFDSADWALGKQGAPIGRPKGPLEALRPKLQPTQHQQVRSRRSAYAPADGEDGGHATSEQPNNE